MSQEKSTTSLATNREGTTGTPLGQGHSERVTNGQMVTDYRELWSAYSGLR